MRVLMVCLGNICRSPMAEAVLGALAPTFTVDSAGISDAMVGCPADPRTLTVLKRHGLTTRHRARQVTAADFSAFDLLLGMDRNNLSALEWIRPPGATVPVRLIGSYDPLGESEVPDPYRDELALFVQVYAQIDRCCRAFIAQHPAQAG